MELPIKICKQRLITLWFVGSGVVFFIVLLQSFFGRYSDQVDEAWSWLLPTVVPTLALMIGVLVADARQESSLEKMVDRFTFSMSFILSLAYFAVILLTIAVQPFTTKPPLELLKLSNLWLAPIQGLVTASLGAFFVRAGRA